MLSLSSRQIVEHEATVGTQSKLPHRLSSTIRDGVCHLHQSDTICTQSAFSSALGDAPKDGPHGDLPNMKALAKKRVSGATRSSTTHQLMSRRASRDCSQLKDVRHQTAPNNTCSQFDARPERCERSRVGLRPCKLSVTLHSHGEDALRHVQAAPQVDVQADLHGGANATVVCRRDLRSTCSHGGGSPPVSASSGFRTISYDTRCGRDSLPSPLCLTICHHYIITRAFLSLYCRLVRDQRKLVDVAPRRGPSRGHR